MTNPFFAPKASPPAKPAEPPREPPPYAWQDPVEKAFTTMVPGGWTADGGLVRFEGGARHIQLEVAGPNGARVFMGDPNLPLRHFVPGPSHVGIGLKQGQRTWFSQSEVAQGLFPSFYRPANLVWLDLMMKRFGFVAPFRVQHDEEQIEAIRSKTTSGGLGFSRIDAAIVDFSSSDDSKAGRVWLSTYGGDGPYQTWDIDFIHGYFGPVDAADRIRTAHEIAFENVKLGFKWAAKNQDRFPATVAATHERLRKADDLDKARFMRARAEWEGKAESSADTIAALNRRIRELL